MDPNETLKEIRFYAKETRDDLLRTREGMNALLDAVEALDKWLSKGGFLPDAWERK